MPSLLALATPLAMLLPFLGQSGELVAGTALVSETPARVPAETVADGNGSPKGIPASQRGPAQRTNVAPLDTFRGGQIVRQVRIESRVILRVSPARSQNRNSLMAQLPQQSLRTQYEERRMNKCVPVTSIAGVQTGSGNRLLLFMRDAKIVSVNLEKACRARDFYSGFYVEQNADGKLCVDRDKLQSRSGAKCEVERMRQLVAIEK
ncbi:hypothetical protein FGU71_11275 [Erythrobacter insulae]|uniref:Uncharacterized protein n=1 Tax=Erythrobacter insulae TaxID=2584124 RepID=A0A547PE28_9SPHN|nr:hypothetical protein [Erythrobacter insulae]TRD12385.1 hypothetical protein FGU71_11275 [Erythrobacter insulae]